MLFETIIAPATPPGEGGIGVVRLSGPDAVSALATCFEGRVEPVMMESHRLYHGRLHDDHGLVDEVLAVVMRAPRSYTGEDVVEVHCHGGGQVRRSVLDLFLKAGVRLAQPGEFTQRAFLNGRLDLSQAEAVIDLIQARSEQAGRVAASQLEGRLSRLIHRYADQLKETLLFLEAHIDFPDDEVGVVDLPPVCAAVQRLSDEIAKLVASFDTGRMLRDGLSILILGRPNVGKSSLMNALLGESRAIVTEFAGTTRDTLEEQMVLGGYPVRLVDSAGMRKTEDPIEREGVRRAEEKLAAADLVLLVVDGAVALTVEDLRAAEMCPAEKTLVIYNKSDQPQVAERTVLSSWGHPVSVSAKYGEGLEALQQAVVDHFSQGAKHETGEDVVLTERRHLDALLRASSALERFLAAARPEEPLECLALEIRVALDALGLITGETTPDEILNEIFDRFCIGK